MILLERVDILDNKNKWKFITHVYCYIISPRVKSCVIIITVNCSVDIYLNKYNIHEENVHENIRDNLSLDVFTLDNVKIKSQELYRAHRNGTSFLIYTHNAFLAHTQLPFMQRTFVRKSYRYGQRSFERAKLRVSIRHCSYLFAGIKRYTTLPAGYLLTRT